MAVTFGDEFKDKVALIAGGTGALGREIAAAFLAAGARVAVTYRLREEFDGLLAAAPPAQATQLSGIATDVTDAKAAAAVVEELVAEHGRLDVLVNAVGGYAGGKNVWAENLATYDRMMALNLESGFALVRAVVPIMRRLYAVELFTSSSLRACSRRFFSWWGTSSGQCQLAAPGRGEYMAT